MSERIPKQPLNDPEYTVPEYSVLLPSEEAKNSTAESNTASNNVAPSSAVDTNTGENNAPGDSTPEHATTDYREATAGYTLPPPNMRVGYVRRLCVAPSGAPPRLLFCRFSPLSSSSCSTVNQSPVWRRYLTLSCVC